MSTALRVTLCGGFTIFSWYDRTRPVYSLSWTAMHQILPGGLLDGDTAEDFEARVALKLLSP